MIHVRQLSETIVECWRDDAPRSCLIDPKELALILPTRNPDVRWRLIKSHALTMRSKPKEV